MVSGLDRVHVEYAETDQRLVFEAMLKRDQGIYVCKALVDGKQFEKKFNLSIFSAFFSVILCACVC